MERLITKDLRDRLLKKINRNSASIYKDLRKNIPDLLDHWGTLSNKIRCIRAAEELSKQGQKRFQILMNETIKNIIDRVYDGKHCALLHLKQNGSIQLDIITKAGDFLQWLCQKIRQNYDKTMRAIFRLLQKNTKTLGTAMRVCIPLPPIYSVDILSSNRVCDPGRESSIDLKCIEAEIQMIGIGNGGSDYRGSLRISEMKGILEICIEKFEAILLWNLQMNDAAQSKRIIELIEYPEIPFATRRSIIQIRNQVAQTYTDNLDDRIIGHYYDVARKMSGT